MEVMSPSCCRRRVVYHVLELSSSCVNEESIFSMMATLDVDDMAPRLVWDVGEIMTIALLL